MTLLMTLSAPNHMFCFYLCSILSIFGTRYARWGCFKFEWASR